MIDITANIRELLFKHDCVILPSFGGFIGNYRPAQIDRKSNIFAPPVKAISFNRMLIHNDGLLIGKISEERKIGYADSKHIVEEFIESLNTRLKKGERVEFDSIGYFQTNNEGNIEFEPNGDVNFLLDSYGFSSFRREPLSVSDLSARANSRDKGSVRSSSTRKMAWRAVIAVPFIAAMIIVPLKTDWLKSNASLNPLSGVELSVGDSGLLEEDILVEEAAVLVQDDNIVTPDIEETLDTKVLDQAETGITYSIVAGSFKSRENALRMLEEAGSKGYSSELSENENGFYRVLLNSYTSKEEAINLRDLLRSDYKDCWILKK